MKKKRVEVEEKETSEQIEEAIPPKMENKRAHSS